MKGGGLLFALLLTGLQGREGDGGGGEDVRVEGGGGRG